MRIARLAVMVLAFAAWSLGPSQAQEKDRAGEIKKLLEERADLLGKAAAGLLAQYEAGMVDITDLQQITREALLARLELQATAEDRVAVLRALCEISKKTVEKVELRRKVGLAKQLDVDDVTGASLTADIELLREQQKVKADPAREAEIKKLLKQRTDAFDRASHVVLVQYEAGLVDLIQLMDVNRATLKAHLEQASTAKERVALLRKFQGVFERMVQKVADRLKVGLAKQVDLDQATAVLLEERIELLREEGKLKADAAQDAQITKLLKERSQALDHAAAVVVAQYDAGVMDVSQALEIQRDALKAKLDLHDKVQARIEILKEFLKTPLVKSVEARRKIGAAQDFQMSQARAEFLAVRIRLLREELKLTARNK